MQNKSKNKIYLIIATLAIILSCISCDDFFEQTAGNRISPDVHFQSQIDLEVSMFGVLAPLQDAMPKLLLIDGLLSDMMTVTNNTDVNISNVNEHIYTVDNPLLNTSDFYKVIINANEVLANIHKISEIDPNFDEFYVKQYKNALIGIRTWAYFTLIKLNGEAALIEDNMTSLPDKGLTYVSKDVMLDTLINQMLPYLHLDPTLAEIEFSYYPNTKALVGEMYLEKNDYANAAIYLKLGMESFNNSDQIYKVNSSYEKNKWREIFISAENIIAENISVIPFKSTDGQVNPFTSWTLYNDQYLVKPTNYIVNLFNSQPSLRDKDGDIYRGNNVSFALTADWEPYITKYAIDLGEPYGSDIVISRAGDYHLLLAEALNRLGEHEIALALVNKGFKSLEKVPSEYRRWNKNVGIRGRAYLQPITIPSSVDNLTEYIEDIIIEERAMELAFEGKRYFDLMRIARRRGDPKYLADKIYGKFSDKNKRAIVTEFMKNEANWYIPLNK